MKTWIDPTETPPAAGAETVVVVMRKATAVEKDGKVQLVFDSKEPVTEEDIVFYLSEK